ncbi:GNAT family N-acetyltransferase [bacterium]|nr:GNAT family N-acetyltransferase [bacterium]
MRNNMMPETSGFARPLEDGLTLRTARTADDIERLAQFNGLIHGPELIPAVFGLANDYPGMTNDDWIFVENEEGEIVSSLCLVPWTLRYGSVDLAVAEMGLVGTLERYRRRGLVRVQVDLFKERMAARGALLSFIQGIPFYYRQFGYEYALPLEGGLRMTGRELPDWETPAFAFRRATVDDLPVLRQFFEEAAQTLAIHTVRDDAHWRFLLETPQSTTFVPEYWLVLDVEGWVVGYFMLPKYHFYNELSINEASLLSYDAALAVLRHCRTLAVERKLPGVRLNLPPSNPVWQLAHAVGAHDMGVYAWQIHVADFAALLRMIAPVLEERIAASPFAGLTRTVKLAFYRDAVELSFARGQLVDVRNGGSAQGPINLPPLKIIPLIFGHTTVEDLRAANPDVNVGGVWRLLLETLLPKTAGFIHGGY